MKLYADRLAKLAGLPVVESGVLSEASNRSYNDDPSLDDESDIQHGKGQLAEGDDDDEDQGEIADHGTGAMEEADAEDLADEDPLGPSEDDGGLDLDDPDGVVLEIDEKMLAQEIKRMRMERLQEADLRQVVRNEIKSIMNSLKERDPALGGYEKFDHSNREKGITQGFPGIGFTK